MPPNTWAIWFVILIGMVSFFADITYEGARSITGQYLAFLGAGGTVIGIVAGLGEFIGYGFRLLSGYLTDRTERYWLLAFVGYALNLLVVPLLALTDNWPAAAGLLILERFGKAIRNPSRDAMLSFATKQTGRGWGFGLHEAMDRTGAVLGPLIVSAILYYQNNYAAAFAFLLIPALCALSVLTFARYLFPRPRDLEVSVPAIETKGFSKKYWIYLGAICCVAAGYVDFPLIAYHFLTDSVVSPLWIPIFFSISMGAAAISALICGRLYDRLGMQVLVVVSLLTPLFAPLVFLNGFYLSLLGMLLWGLGLGVQESIMRAVVADLVPVQRRGTAYGVLNIGFGISWFLGSALMGVLYDVSLPSLIAFSLGIQLLSVPLFIAVKKII